MMKHAICVLIVLSITLSAGGQLPSPGLQLVPQLGHSVSVSGVAFASDGKTVATVSGDGIVKLWVAATGELIRSLVGHSGGINAIAFAPDGATLATGCANGTIDLLDTATGAVRQTLVGHRGAITEIVFSPHGSMMATIARNPAVVLSEVNDSLSLWDTTTGKELHTWGKKGYPLDVAAFSPDGKTVVAGGRGALLWNAVTGDTPRRLPGSFDPGLASVAFSPDGRTIVAGAAGADYTVQWDAATGKAIELHLGHDGGVMAIGFSPDGRLLATGGRDDGTVKLRDMATGRETLTLGTPTGPGQGVTALMFAPDGQTLVVGYAGHPYGAKLWNVTTGALIRTFANHTYPAFSVAFSPDGHTLATGFSENIGSGTGMTSLWDAATGRQVRALDDHRQLMTIAFSPDGHTLATSNGKLWDVTTGKELRSLGSNDFFSFAAFSPDGHMLATIGHTRRGDGVRVGTIKFWDVATGKEVGIMVAPPGCRTLVFAPDGRTMATTSQVTTAQGFTDSAKKLAYAPKIWDVASGKEVRSLIGHTSEVMSLAFSPNGRKVATGARDGTIDFWEPATGVLIQTLSGAGANISTVVFSPDGQMVASGTYDGTVKLWDSATGKELCTLQAPPGLWTLAFSTDGKILATGGNDGATRLWSAVTGRELGTLLYFTDGTWIVAAPDGRFDVPSLENDIWSRWVADDSPLMPLPITVFMRDYYEPGLFAKIWRGEKLRSVKNVLELSRARPDVEITAARVQDDVARITVVVKRATLTLASGKEQVGLPQDLRVLRDGRLVGYEDVPLKLDAQGQWTKTFVVPLPRNGETEVEITAYCFNQDRVKSDTVRQNLKLALTRRQGRAYIIAVGVDRYARKDLTLHYAAADARAMASVLTERLKPGYLEVVTVPLLSDDGHHDIAIKKNIHAIFERLAGRPADVAGIPGASKVQKATGEDLIIITWSGHGLSRAGGAFYLLPQDVKDDPDTFGKPFLDSCISTDELTQWMRDVDAGDVALIIDACHSAAAVQNEDFRPAPLGNRGLGQLAYDKGIRVLAATQAADVALESGVLGNGLLTYALIHDGLEMGKAFKNGEPLGLKDWLSYSLVRVPELYVALRNGTLKPAKGARSVLVSSMEKKGAAEFRQTPALFDFNRKPSPLPFIVQ